MDTIIKEINEMEKWVEECYKRSDLHEYHTLMDLGITIGNYLRKLTILTFSTMTEDEAKAGKETFGLHDAVIVGHLVRLYKLYDQLVYFVSENKGEIASIFIRLMFETFVVMKYLIIRGKPSIDNFIKISFKSTIKQYQYIKGLEVEREFFDIEKRIINKIDNRLSAVGLDASKLTLNKNWKLDGLTFKGILDFLKKHDSDPDRWGLSYDFIFGNSSSFVHGSWGDIEINHLTQSNGQYSPKATYYPVDPRFILPASFIPIMACTDFLKWRKTDPDNFLGNILEKIGDLLMHLNLMDEERIKRKDNPTTLNNMI